MTGPAAPSRQHDAQRLERIRATVGMLDGDCWLRTEGGARKAINWALGIANRPAIVFAAVASPVPKPALTGMPLFDHGAVA